MSFGWISPRSISLGSRGRNSGHARTGWRVPVGDAAAQADALAEALALGASARAALAERARLHVSGRFSIARAAAAALDAYVAALRRDVGERLT